MKLIIDDANIDQIKTIYEYYPVDGVTTNPTILAKSKRAPYEVLREIRGFIGGQAELHVQVVARTAAGMMEDAHRIVKELGENTFVKVPSVPEGFKAMMALKRRESPLPPRPFTRLCRHFWLQSAVRPTLHPISTGSIIWAITESRWQRISTIFSETTA